MGVVAELGRLAVCTWAPSGSHIAAGTYAGAVDTSFESSSSLELLALDVANGRLVPGPALRQPEKFSAIAWGPVSRAHVAGLVAGGLNDGAVRVWDAASLLRPATDASLRDQNRGLLFAPSTPARHAGPVHGLGFNHFVGTLLASGGADGQVLIWDLSTASKPSIHAPGTMEPNTKDEIVAVAWNPKVQHILGTGSNSGVVSVWDLKNRKQVIYFRNPKGRFRASSIVWHPSVATQILVACDEDDGTGAQLWDLRKATAPLLSLSHHAPRGILSAAWCPHDPDLLLTTSRDGRSTIVSPSDGSLVVELPKTSTWNFNVQWSPRYAGLFLASSFDGRVSLSSVLTANAAPSVSAETAHALAESFGPDVGDFQSGMAVQSPRAMVAERENVTMARPPIWLSRPSSISFGFGGRVVMATKKSSSTVTFDMFCQDSKTDNVVSSVDDVLERSSAQDPAPLAEFCKKSSAEAADSTEKMAWELLGIQFQTDARRKLLEYLRYKVSPASTTDSLSNTFGIVNAPALASPTRIDGDATGPAQPPDDTSNVVDKNSVSLDSGMSHNLQHLSIDGPAPWDIGGGADVGIASESLLDDSLQDSAEITSAGLNGEHSLSEQSKDGNIYAGMSDTDIEEYVKRSVIVGDFECAVNACFYGKRPADALLIAHAGGRELWERSQREYLSSAGSIHGAHIVGAISGPRERMDEFIKTACDAGKDNWKDALAVIVTYAKSDGFSETCSALGQRLLSCENYSAALMCFICACNTRMTTLIWLRGRPASGNLAAALASRMERLTGLVAKVRIAAAAASLANGEQDLSAVRPWDDLSATVLLEYGSLLAAQGNLASASRYLQGLDSNVGGVWGSAGDMQAKVSCYVDPQATADISYSSQTNGAQGLGYVSQQALAPEPFPGMYDFGGSQGSQGVQLPSNTGPPLQQAWNNSQNLYAPPAIPSPPTAMSSYGNPPPLPQPTTLFGANMPSPNRPKHEGYSKTFYPNHNPSNEVGVTDTSPHNGYSVMTPSVSSAHSVPPLAVTPPPPPVPFSSLDYNGNVSSPARGHAPVPMQGPAPMNSSILNSSSVPQVQTVTGSLAFSPAVMPVVSVHDTSAPPPPPPPPPVDALPPMSYHANAMRGAGASLPPSSEIAVAKQRQKPLSSSGVPGGAPRRSPSASSSLSSMGVNSAVHIDKVDVSNMPADEQIISKALRGAYQYALNRSSTMLFKKKMDDVSKKLGQLLFRLNARDMEPSVVQKLIGVAQSISKGDYESASAITTALGKEVEWELNRHWIQALHRLIDAVLTGR